MATVVLAYTGGINSSVAIHWLQNRKGLKVFTFTGNFGGYANQEVVCERALAAGAVGAHIGDLRRNFLLYFAFPALRAGSRIGQGHFLSRALSRPLIVEEIAKIASENGYEYLAHCCPPDSNDHFRFERIVAAIAPQLKIIDPWSQWPFRGRRDVCEYAAGHGIEALKDEVDCVYQVDKNIWGSCVEYGPQDDPWREVADEMYTMTSNPEQAPAKPVYVKIDFRSGTPVGIDGERLEAPELVETLNQLGARAGIGRYDMINDGLSGRKRHFLYEAPGAAILYAAHAALENMTISMPALDFKQIVAARFARVIHEGHWYTPLRKALDAFVEETQVNVTGTVRVKLLQGTCRAVGVKSDYALYRPEPPSRESGPSAGTERPRKRK